MPDRLIPLYTVAMICKEPQIIAASLPEGYSYEFFKPGMEDAWCQIQRSVRAFPDAESARKWFDAEFQNEYELLAKRLIFVCDRRHRAVATGVLWHNAGINRMYWIAVIPGMHHRGIGQALTSRLIALYYEEKCQGPVSLVATTRDFRAINIYRKCGFMPDPGVGILENPLSQEDYDRAWNVINEKITDYEKRRKRNLSPDGVPVMSMRMSSDFTKSSMCNIFTLSSPGQSGNTPHYHDYSQVWYVLQGSCEHRVEGQTYTMSVGDAFFVPPKVTHTTILAENSSIVCCEFDIEKLLQHNVVPYDKIKEITQNISFSMLFQRELYQTRPQFTFSREGQRQMERLMTTMLDEYKNGDEYFEDFLQLQILQMLLILAREIDREPAAAKTNLVYEKYRTMVEMAVHYIDEHYDQPLTLEGMCRISMVSKTYFCYIFKILTGKTFVEYLMEKRVEQSMTLLRETDMTIIEIGHAVGFHEPTHFSRTFKRLRGISPREYRNTTVQPES